MGEYVKQTNGKQTHTAKHTHVWRRVKSVTEMDGGTRRHCRAIAPERMRRRAARSGAAGERRDN